MGPRCGLDMGKHAEQRGLRHGSDRGLVGSSRIDLTAKRVLVWNGPAFVVEFLVFFEEKNVNF